MQFTFKTAFGDKIINNDYEVSYLAGYSIDGKTIYIDKRLPRYLTLKDGRKIDVYPYLIEHESWEKHLEDNKNYRYSYAHEKATGKERAKVESDNIDWDEYQNYMLKMVKELKEFNTPVPPDLDLKPEKDSHDYYRYHKIKKMEHESNSFYRKVHATYKIIIASKLDPSAFKPSPYYDSEEGMVDLEAKPPKILYHVTHIKNLSSIRKKGLLPKVGEVTRSAHGDERHAATPLVYLSDKVAPGILGTFGKDALIITVDPSENNIWFFTGNELVEVYSDKWGKTIEEGDFPIGIEVGDFYSEVKVVPKEFFDYKGNSI